ncbi:PilZ domain-containing protein [Pacificimonas sp. WHA3]|uniref:PilZ domain-containing protein n=1 Tax=Pacificimonas pallii TaxID=2827236 RepID=A0ABS6SG85_9SPHN|nr:PilZ domain-containing protein [Pacificimonas pallii]MBV7256891.1 PilZ domain-containing protein [Pacificimonas pallii]
MTNVTFRPTDEPRAQPRADANHLAALIRDGKPSNARVIDVSQTGVCVETALALSEAEDLVYTSVRMGRRPAIVIWCENGVAGLAFTDDIARLAEARGQPAARHWLSVLRKN